MLSNLGTASPRCAVTPLHCSLNRATVALHGDCDAILGQPALSHRRSRLGRPLAMADAPRPRPQLSGALLVSDCAALVVYGLLASALKAFALAGSDLLSPGFDLAADLASFDLDATMRYVNVEYFAAASLALG